MTVKRKTKDKNRMQQYPKKKGYNRPAHVSRSLGSHET